MPARTLPRRALTRLSPSAAVVIAAAVTLRLAYGSPTTLLRPVVTALQTTSPA